jgi:hypothetical protein
MLYMQLLQGYGSLSCIAARPAALAHEPRHGAKHTLRIMHQCCTLNPTVRLHVAPGLQIVTATIRHPAVIFTRSYSTHTDPALLPVPAVDMLEEVVSDEEEEGKAGGGGKGQQQKGQKGQKGQQSHGHKRKQDQR